MQQANTAHAPGSGLSRRSALALVTAGLVGRRSLAASLAPVIPPPTFADAAVLVPPDRALQIRHIGGSDGVTAANQFEARIQPDGQTALLVPGAAAMAWLRGDPRAQFDVGHWLPVATALVSGVLIMRNGGVPAGSLRLAVEGDATLALPALLGLDLVGETAGKLIVCEDALAELRLGHADAAFLRGDATGARLAMARAAGMQALFTLGNLDPANQLQRDPFLPDVPTLPELLFARPQSPPDALLAAWHAAAAASRLDMALLLPWLTPPGLVAWWRGVCGQIGMPHQQDPARPELGATASRVWRTDPNGNFGLTAIVVDGATSLALHRWMTTQPS